MCCDILFILLYIRVTCSWHVYDCSVCPFINWVLQQPRREAMAARGGLSHLLDNFEDLRRPSSPSGLGPRFSSSSGWIDSPS